MKTHCLVIAVLIAAALPCAWIAAQDEEPALVNPAQTPGEEIPPPKESAPLAGSNERRFVGTASCTAANCHGGDGSRPVRPAGDPLSPQAYSLWIQNDPHAGAFELLYDAPSQKIAERLGLPNAYTAKVCLDCHGIDAKETELTAAARHTPHDGVGCEACHGAAEAWLDPHKWEAWSSLSAARKSALGYRDLTDLVQRAETCAACHVGSAGRDVNHDLIAAGHPRMTFELSAYHANLPKHWKNVKTPRGELDARLWLVGQAVSARSSLGLLAQRANDSRAPWPELSEYDCFACHHDLADPSWRQREFNASAGLAPGAAAWGTWYYSLVPLIPTGGLDAAGDGLDKLRVEMQRLLPHREAVKALAAESHRELTALAGAAASQPLGPRDRRALIRRLTDLRLNAPVENWDVAAQRFLGATAMNYSAQVAAEEAGGEAPRELEAIDGALRRIRGLLQFSEDRDSAQYNSPQNQSTDRRRAVREAFEEIHRTAEPDSPDG